VVEFHQQMIELGKESLFSASHLNREVSTISICLDSDQMQKIKMMIQEFESKVLAEEKDNKKNRDVYQLNVQFFPVTKTSGEESK